jgi:type 1 glutamine amidotransferase
MKRKLTSASALVLVLISFAFCKQGYGYAKEPAFKALVLTERGDQHEGFVSAALKWLKVFAKQNNMELTVINSTKEINDAYLAKYKVFIQLNFPPYNWSDESKAAFQRYIEQGRGGWVGFHHATLLGEYDGYEMWDWFSGFMGGIRFKDYNAKLVSGIVHVERTKHPVFKGVPKKFTLGNEEWYTYNKNPRPGITVLANVDESSYHPSSNIKMGDHPVIWTNEKMKARNVYFQMGHHTDLLKSAAFKQMFANAIFWAAKTKT